MSTQTNKFGFIKPELNDPADITTLNTNWDYLDEIIPTNPEDIDAARKDHTHTASDVGAVPLCKNVSSMGADLNSYKTEGTYYFGENYTPLNIPSGINGWLDVKVYGNAVKQIWYRFGTPGETDHEMFTRTHATSTGWGPWVKVITEKNAKCFGSLVDIGITEFPTTMAVVAEKMPQNSMIVIDTRLISKTMSGGEVSDAPQEILDWGQTVNGTAYINKGYNIARITMMLMYGSGDSSGNNVLAGNWSHTTNKVQWTSLTNHIYSTKDLTPGTSALETGKIYFVYE